MYKDLQARQEANKRYEAVVTIAVGIYHRLSRRYSSSHPILVEFRQKFREAGIDLKEHGIIIN